jgi:hypothetical protein
MEALDVLPRIPAIADATQRTRPENVGKPQPEDTGRPWTLVATEPGHPGHSIVEVSGHAQGRVVALELSELGFMITMRDADNQVRLRIWPPP